MPYVVESKPIQSTLNNIFHCVGSASMLFLCIFAWIIFRGQISWLFLTGFISTAISWSIYGFASSSGFWGVDLSPSTVQRLGDFTVTIGTVFLYLLLSSQNLLNRAILKATCATSIIALLMIVFGGSDEVSQGAVQLNFIVYFVSLLDIFWRTFYRMAVDSSRENIAMFAGFVIFIVSTFNDMLMTAGAIETLMIFPIGLTVMMVSLGFFIHAQIEIVYEERDNFREQLDKSYQEKIALIQKNAVAHAVANTAQMIAHDLKRPFSIFQFALHQIKSGKADEKALEHFSTSITREMVYVDSLISDLLISGSTRTNKLEPIKLEEIVSEVWYGFDRQSITFDTHFAHTDLLFADIKKVTRIVANLIGNATDALLSTQGNIWVSSKHVSVNGRTYAMITIGNSGSYIPPEEIPLLFTKFHTRGKESGSGLGLAICHDFVSDHGGEIWCKSTLTEGTEFIFTLPTIQS